MAKSLIPVHDAGRWVPCTGSVMLQAQYPRLPGDESTSAREGNAFHWLAYTMAKAFITGENASPIRTDYVDKPAPNGELIDDTMYQSAVDWCTEIFRYCNQDGCMRDVYLETNLAADFIMPGEVCRPDAWIYNKHRQEIVVMDAKYGHTFVDVYENWSLILYAEAILRHLDMDGIDDQNLTIRLGIFQPRAFHHAGTMRWWVFPAHELRAHVNTAVGKAHEALEMGATCNPGPWCKGCSGRRVCTALQGSTYQLLDHISDSSTFAELEDDNLSFELRLLRRGKKLLQARLDAMEEQATHKLKTGGRLNGFAMEPTKGREKWTSPVDEIRALGEMYDVDLLKPQEPVTPAQARKLGVDEDVISAYATQHTTGMKLVEQDGSKARQAFKSKGI